jgi:hypothetical protein
VRQITDRIALVTMLARSIMAAPQQSLFVFRDVSGVIGFSPRKLTSSPFGREVSGLAVPVPVGEVDRPGFGRIEGGSPKGKAGQRRARYDPAPRRGFDAENSACAAGTI